MAAASPGETDERLVDQKARVRVAAQQVGQGRHVEGAAIGIVGIHDHGKCRAGGNLELREIECEAVLGSQRRFRVALRDLGKQYIGRGQQMHLLTEAREQLA
jgi:hypothetical protein